MAYNVTKPNIYFSGNKNVLSENTVNNKSKFKIKMTHARDDVYSVINNSTKDIIEIEIEPSNFIDNSVLTNYVMFPNDFSEKTISFVAPNGYNVYYSGDYTRAKYTENTIIAIQQISSNKIVICIQEGEKEYKYGVLLTLETTTANETVHYHETDSSIDTIEFYWDFESENNLGDATHNNYHKYNEPGEHKLLVLSNINLQFPNVQNFISGSERNDILFHTLIIDKYKSTKCLLFHSDTTFQSFSHAKKLEYIREAAAAEIIDENVKTFSPSFFNCNSLKDIPIKLFDINGRHAILNGTFYNCNSLTSIPNSLFDNLRCTSFDSAFYECNKLQTVPFNLFDACTPDGSKEVIFRWCFYKCYNITSTVPELWNKDYSFYMPTTNFSREYCFYGCTKAKNYNDIPRIWIDIL